MALKGYSLAFLLFFLFMPFIEVGAQGVVVPNIVKQDGVDEDFSKAEDLIQVIRSVSQEISQKKGQLDAQKVEVDEMLSVVNGMNICHSAGQQYLNGQCVSSGTTASMTVADRMPAGTLMGSCKESIHRTTKKSSYVESVFPGRNSGGKCACEDGFTLYFTKYSVGPDHLRTRGCLNNPSKSYGTPGCEITEVAKNYICIRK